VTRGTERFRVILLVEDEWVVRDVLASELRNAGWQVIEASTAEGALALLETRQEIDLLLTDIQLAGHLSGWVVAERYRAARSDLPVIYACENSADRSRSVQGSLFFDKPYDVTEVVEACSRYL
jgi:CheY-like chemotaxis protein